MTKNKQKNGFTLVELIVYVAISSIVFITAINVGWDLILAQTNTIGKRDIYMNARLIMNQLQTNIREADDFTIIDSDFDTLNLDYPGTTKDIVIDTYTTLVTIGGEEITIRRLRFKEGILDAVNLTTDKTNITDFSLTELTRGSENKNIDLSLTLEKVNPGNNPNFDADITLNTSLSLRK